MLDLQHDSQNLWSSQEIGVLTTTDIHADPYFANSSRKVRNVITSPFNAFKRFLLKSTQEQISYIMANGALPQNNYRNVRNLESHPTKTKKQKVTKRTKKRARKADQWDIEADVQVSDVSSDGDSDSDTDGNAEGLEFKTIANKKQKVGPPMVMQGNTLLVEAESLEKIFPLEEAAI